MHAEQKVALAWPYNQSFVGLAFSSEQRITSSDVYEQALRHKGLTNKWFTVHTVNSNQNCARLGMIVSKRVIPHAVKRNLAKRLVRETSRLASSDLPKLDFVVRIRRDLSVCNREEARTALIKLMRDSTNNSANT